MTALTCDSLGELNHGLARGVIDAALRMAVADLNERGSEDDKVRKVIITVEMERMTDDDIAVRVDVGTKLPAYRTDATICRLNYDDGELGAKFEPESPKNPDQKTIPFDEPKKKAE